MQISEEEIDHVCVEATKDVVAARLSFETGIGTPWDELATDERDELVEEMRDLIVPVLKVLPEPRIEPGRQAAVPLEDAAHAVAKATSREKKRCRKLTPRQRNVFESQRLALVTLALRHLIVVRSGRIQGA